MTTVAERAARGEPIAPDMNNEWELAPFIDDAFRETLAGMSEMQKATLARAMIAGNRDEWAAMIEREVIDFARDQAHDAGNV